MNIVTWDIEIPVPDTHLSAARATLEDIRDYRYVDPAWNILVVPKRISTTLMDGSELINRRYLKRVKTDYDALQ